MTKCPTVLCSSCRVAYLVVGGVVDVRLAAGGVVDAIRLQMVHPQPVALQHLEEPAGISETVKSRVTQPWPNVT